MTRLPSLQKKSAPSLRNWCSLSLHCRNRSTFFSLPKNLGLPFFSETGVPIIVGASVPPLPERNRCAFYFLRSGCSSSLPEQASLLFLAGEAIPPSPPRAALCKAYFPHLFVWAPSLPKCRLRLPVSLLRDSIYSAMARFDAEVGKILASETCTKQDVTSQKTVICARKFIFKNYVERR